MRPEAPVEEGPAHVLCLWSLNPFLPLQVRALRERTKELPDDYWVVLVGDLITEEALPTYMAMLNTLDGVRDETVRILDLGFCFGSRFLLTMRFVRQTGSGTTSLQFTRNKCMHAWATWLPYPPE